MKRANLYWPEGKSSHYQKEEEYRGEREVYYQKYRKKGAKVKELGVRKKNFSKRH